MNIIVTTTQSELVNNLDDLNRFVYESGFNFVSRSHKGINILAQENQADGVVVWQPEGPVLYLGEKKFFFHPSMAKNRITAFRKQNTPDLMVRACGIESEYEFLDCTLGLGADAIVASYFCAGGRVVGLEVVPEIYEVVKWGMKLYQSKMPWLNQIIKRIEVYNYNHYSYLKQQADDSFDVVYFDPMFRKPILHSEALAPLREMADHSPLQRDTILQACRVARKRVVMKEQADSGEMERLGFKKISGSKNNPIGYGVIDISD